MPKATVKPKTAIFVMLVLCLLALPLFVDVRGALEAVVTRLQAFGPLGLAMLSAFYVVACVLMLPGSVITLGAGALAAVLWPHNNLLAVGIGTAAVSVGSTCGATAAFLLGRGLFREAITAKMQGNRNFAALDHAIGENGLKMVFLVRLSPAFPFSLLNYALGLTKVSLRDYVLGSWIGMIPGTVMYVYLGSLFGFAAKKESAGLGGTVLFAVGLLATITLVVYVTRIARRALAEALAAQEAQT